MTVLYLQASLSETNQRALEGARRFAMQAGWNLVAIHYGAAAKAGDIGERLDSPRVLREVLSSRSPAGCIVEDGQFWRRLAPAAAKSGIPIVIYDGDPTARHIDGAPCVMCDNAAVVAAVSRELFSFGFNDYAYVPHHDRQTWNVVRENLFRSAVEQNRSRYHLYDKMDRNINVLSSSLVSWLKALPRPCGVFAANDQVSQRVLDAAEAAGISVPGELMIVGVDDELVKCEKSAVTLSSVRMDVEAGGRAAAEMLDELIRSGRVRTGVRYFGVAYLVRRSSSRPLRVTDARVTKALDAIRCGIGNGMSAQDVAKQVGLPLRTLHRRFLKAVGHTMGAEIRECRFEMAKHLLKANEASVTQIAALCGYDSDSTLRRIFKRRLGQSPMSWRETAH